MARRSFVDQSADGSWVACECGPVVRAPGVIPRRGGEASDSGGNRSLAILCACGDVAFAASKGGLSCAPAPSASHGCRWWGPGGLGWAKSLSLLSLSRAAGPGLRGWACTAAGSSLAANEGGPSPGAAARPFLPPGGCGCGEPVPHVAALCTVLVGCGEGRRIQIVSLPSAFAKNNITWQSSDCTL